MKRAAITGVTGQDGSYLAEHLLSLGYSVTGFIRPGTVRMGNLRDAIHHKNFSTSYGDIRDAMTIHILAYSGFDEVYHLAACAQAGQTTNSPISTYELNFMPLIKLVEELKLHSPQTRLLFPSSIVVNDPIDSPYVAAKRAATDFCTYARSQGLYVVTTLAHHHDSARLAEGFLMKKLVTSLAEGKDDMVYGLSETRDWHDARDGVTAMHLTLQQPGPSEYVLASGRIHTMREYLQIACECLGVPFTLQEVDVDSGKMRIPGNPKKVEALGWKRNHSFYDMVASVCRGVKEQHP